MERGSLVNIFARCSRLLVKLTVQIEDRFFSGICENESDVLFHKFVKIIALKGRPVDAPVYVAQYIVKDLLSQIKGILRLLEIMRYLKLVDSDTPLLLERDLLLFNLAIIDFHKSLPKFSSRVEVVRHNSDTRSPETQNYKKSSGKAKVSVKLSDAHQQILDLLKNKDKTQNHEVFSGLSIISTRTLKRKLSELIKYKLIKRIPEGKKVFYSINS